MTSFRIVSLSTSLVASLMLLGSGVAVMAESSSTPNSAVSAPVEVENSSSQVRPTYSISRLVTQRVQRDLAKRLNVSVYD